MLLDSSDRIWCKHHNDQVDAAVMRRRQLHCHDSRNISCRDTVDLHLLDEASTALLARSPACLEPELFDVLNKMLFVCGSAHVWGHTLFVPEPCPRIKKSVLWYLWGMVREMTR